MERQDPRKTVNEIRALLEELFTTPGPFAITNDSFKVLLEGMWKRLDDGLAHEPTDNVFKSAHGHVQNLRNVMWMEAQTGELAFKDGMTIPLMTEDRARKALALCPPKPKW